MVNSPVIRPYFWGGGWHWGGTLGSHDILISKEGFFSELEEAHGIRLSGFVLWEETGETCQDSNRVKVKTCEK